MADNVIISTGSGTTIATDQVGTAHYQKVKLIVGASDTATPILMGQTSMDASLPVVIASNQSTVPVSVVAFTPGGTQNVSVVNTPTITVSTALALVVDNVTTGTLSISAGNIAVSNTPTVTVSTALALKVTTGTISVSGTQTVIFGATQAVTAANVTVASIAAGTISTVLAMPVLSASNVSIASITAGTLNKLVLVDTVSTVSSVTTILALPVLSATNVTVASITTGTLSISAGNIAISNTPTVTVSTVLAMPVLSASNISIASITAGTLDKITLVSTISTLLGTIAVSGGGGGVQYSIADTSMAATGTGTLILGMQSGATTSRALALTVTGGLSSLASVTTILALPVLSATNVTIASITTGSVSIVGGPTFYVPGAAIASGTGLGGPMFIGVQSGATLGRGLMLTTTGHHFVDTVRLLSTGTVDVVSMPVLSATNITVASITAGTVTALMSPVYINAATTIAATGTGILMMGVQSGATTSRALALTVTGQQLCQLSTGTVNVINVISATGVLLAATTANVGAFVATAHGSRWDAYAVNVTSAASVILKTSGAHTLYVTDLLLSVDVPMMVTLMSAATTKLVAYFATKGGLVIDLNSPMVLNSAQSLTFQGGASGSCAGFACGFTVT